MKAKNQVEPMISLLSKTDLANTATPVAKMAKMYSEAMFI